MLIFPIVKIVCVQLKLEAIDKKVSKLDVIEKNISEIKVNMANLEQKVEALEVVKLKVDQLETSTVYMSECFEEWKTEQAQTKIDLKDLKTKMDSIDITKLQERLTHDSSTVVELKAENILIKEYLIDQRCRSMRDNLIFTGIAETADTYEDTETVLKKFIKDELKQDPEQIDFKRIHRIGTRRSRSDKPRSIIAKFNVTSQRDLIKSCLLYTSDAADE